MLRLYTFLLFLAMPLVFLRLWWRGFRQPAYRHHWRERLGYVSGPVENSDVVWIHAVSVGEVRAAAPLVNALLQRDPGTALLITTTTPTGRETVQRLFGERVQCCYLPWDLPFSIQRFLSSFSPKKLIVMETELWPNLFHSVKQRGIPLYLVNARLSDASLRGYRRVLPLVRKTLSCVTSIAAQSEADVSRFIALGAPQARVQCAGNLKYEVELPADFDLRRSRLRQQFGQRTMWVAGSTHPGEESVVLSVHARILQRYPDGLLFLVPRHPERAKEVAALCTQSDMTVVLYSDLAASLSENTRVVVVDVLGELTYLYGLAPLAFIGGSMVPQGGQNPIEALQAGCAVITGEHVDNFADSYRELERAEAVSCIRDEEALVKVVDDLLGDVELRQRQLVAAEQVLDGNRGALERVLVLTVAAETQ